MPLMTGMLIPAGCAVCLLGSAAWAQKIPADGLVLHLDGARVGPAGPLERWSDSSGGGRDPAQSDPAKRPRVLAGALNGLPVVRFDGAAFLDGPPVLAEGCSTMTFAALWRRDKADAAAAICEQADDGVGRRASLLAVGNRYGFNGQNNDQHGLLVYQPGLWTLSVMTLDDTGLVRLWHNDERTATGASGPISRALQNTGARVFRIGCKITGESEFLEGEVAEVLVWDRVLEWAEVDAVNRALSAKWGVGQPSEDGARKVDTMTIERMNEGPDYTSRVPRYTFGTTLAEQEAQLRDNPMLARFAESRRRLATDRFRPLYHFTSPESSLNDPNGLCFWQGRWHLFYQGYPPEDPRQHWGHAVSEDLIHWRDLPYAIYPSPEECCFSGAAWVDPDRVIAMYHGTQVGNMVAVSNDPLLLNWEKVTGGPVITSRLPDGTPAPYNVFDPCIWKQGDWYYSLSAGTLPGPANQRVRADFLLRSRDLATWEYLHPLVDYDPYGLVGDDGACPYFVPIGDKYMLIHFSHMSGGKYLIGDYDTVSQRLIATNGGSFNFGVAWPAGVHAPSAAPDGKGGVVAIFNMNPAYPTQGWDQMMSLPRRLTLGPDGDLMQEPTGDYASLRGAPTALGETVLPANREIVLDAVQGSSIEFIAEIDPQGSPTVELNVLRSPDGGERTRILLYRNRGFHYWNRGGRPGQDSLVSLDISCSSLLPDAATRAPETAPVYLADGEPFRLHVFLDRSIVEVFVNGRQCVAARVYPGRDDSVGVSLLAHGRDAVLRSLQSWQMGSAFAG